MRMWGRWIRSLAVVVIGTAGAPWPSDLAGQAPVRAVLFFSPTCPHCHKVITQDLPNIFDQFGGPGQVWVDDALPREERVFYLVSNDQIEILLIDVSRPAGGALYDRATQQFSVPRERMGVPRLVFGDSVLVGSVEIPSQLPTLIEQAAAAGGIDWPAIDGLPEHVAKLPAPVSAPPPPDPRSPPTATSPGDAPHREEADTSRTVPANDPVSLDHAADSVPDENPAPTQAMDATLDLVPNESASVWARFGRDPMGNGLALLVLLVMLASVYVVFARAPGWHARTSPSSLVPILGIAGILVAGYLTYIETNNATAVCGPVGDCNAVQQSPYAYLFGVPVAVLGLVGYVAIVLAWLAGRGRGRLATWSALSQFVLVFVGVLLSSYLTFLEPFVIGASCLWCLSSAVILTAMLWLVAGPGFQAYTNLRGAD